MYQFNGERVRKLRKRKDWTQGQLLVQIKRHVGDKRFSRNTLSRIENGHYDSEPSWWMVDALARALDTSHRYILGLDDDPRPVSSGDTDGSDAGDLMAWLEVEQPELALLYRLLLDMPEAVSRRVLERIEADIQLMKEVSSLDKEDRSHGKRI